MAGMTLSFRPLSPHVGVEVTGLDLRAPRDVALAAQLQAALRDCHFLLIRQLGLVLGEFDGQLTPRHASPRSKRRCARSSRRPALERLSAMIAEIEAGCRPQTDDNLLELASTAR